MSFICQPFCRMLFNITLLLCGHYFQMFKLSLNKSTSSAAVFPILQKNVVKKDSYSKIASNWIVMSSAPRHIVTKIMYRRMNPTECYVVININHLCITSSPQPHRVEVIWSSAYYHFQKEQHLSFCSHRSLWSINLLFALFVSDLHISWTSACLTQSCQPSERIM